MVVYAEIHNWSKLRISISRMLCRLLWDTHIISPPRFMYHLRKILRAMSQRTRAQQYLLDMTEWVNS